MPVDQPFNIYREQLISKYHGLALWNPKPVKGLYDHCGHISIGDVGYLCDGDFIRMFNVTLPWDDSSNEKFGRPEKYETLKQGHIRENEFYEAAYHSLHVSKEENTGNAETPDEAKGQAYKCRARSRGALLTLPHGGHREDIIGTKSFENYIRDHVVSWFAWAQNNDELGVERMEDLILVTGCTLVTSWAAAALDDYTTPVDATSVSLDTQRFDRGRAQFFWRNIRGNVECHNSHFDPNDEQPLPQNQCVFIRGFRAKRVFFRTRPIRAAAEPLPDDPDNRREDEIQVTRIPDVSNYRDPLIGILDYIVEKCLEDVTAEDIIAIAHDDDLQFVKDVETLTADTIEKFLREKQMPLLVENGAAVLRNLLDNEPSVSDAKKAALYTEAELHHQGEPPRSSLPLSRLARFATSMGTRLSSVLPRLILGASLRDRPKGSIHHEPLRDAEDGVKEQSKVHAPTPKRRALLIGISYHDSTDPVWTPLEGPLFDVNNFLKLLIHTYGYSPEDIVVLEDDPSFPDHLQPTRTNMIREFKQLVSGAAPGDMFTLLYSGHSDQQASLDDDEEDDHNEVIITCDLRRIIDNELNYILIKDLPVGCSLSAIFDTCHSGTMLDLPHYHCNDVYIPWLTKGNRHTSTRTMHNKIVRNHAFDLVSLPNSPSRVSISTTVSVVSTWLSDTRPSSSQRINTEVGGVLSANQREMEAGRQGGTSVLSPTRYSPALSQARYSPVFSTTRYSPVLSPTRYSPVLSPTRYSPVLSPTRYSPVSRMGCDGWCRFDLVPRATVVSLSACADLQRAREGPRGSLTAVLCEFLEKQPSPSYRTLMTHVNHQLHANCRSLHKYILEEKKKAARGEGPGFDGEMNNFQAPQLSSLSRLNMDDTLRL